MSLGSVRQIESNSQSFKSLINNNASLQNNPTTKKSFYLNEDKFDDGKISAKKGLKHFIKGVISPVEILFSSSKNILIGIGVIVGSAALCAAFPPLLPVMVAFGVTTGSWQLLSGGYKAMAAKTDKQAEEAWENIGAGTFAVGTSALGAKSSLKAAGVKKTEDLNILKATIECFKQIPKSITKSYKMAKNGTAHSNLKNTLIKPKNYADIDDIAKLKKHGYSEKKLFEIKKYSEDLYQEGLKAINQSKEELTHILPENLRNKINYRVKSPSSIKDKLISKLIDSNKIESLDDARSLIGDLLGSNIALENVDDAQIELIMDSCAKALRKGEIKFTAIDNYKGEKIKPYLTKDHIDTLREASMTHNTDIQQYEGFGSLEVSGKVKKSGYTSAQINIEYKDGSLGEFQIRGKEVHKLADIEHIPYDLRRSKDLAGGNHLLKKLYEPLEKNVKLLSNNGYDEYNNYLNALYRYHRKAETGIAGLKKPQIKDYMISKPSEIVQSELPLSKQETENIYNNIIKMLDIDNIETLHNEAGWLKEIPKTDKIKVILQSITTYLATEKNNNEKWSENNAYI